MYPPHIQCSDAALHADHIGLSLSPTNAHIKLPLHRLATVVTDHLRRDLAAMAGPGREGNRSCSYTDQVGEHDVQAGGLRVAELTLVGRQQPLSLGQTDSSCRPAEKKPPPTTRRRAPRDAP